MRRGADWKGELGAGELGGPEKVEEEVASDGRRAINRTAEWENYQEP